MASTISCDGIRFGFDPQHLPHIKEVMQEEKLMQLAKQAGLPVSWYTSAIEKGEKPNEWRELKLFAELVIKEKDNLC